jgi:hypothetical protein
MSETLFTYPDDRVIEPMIALARCTSLQRILVAGAKSIELVFELQRRGFARVAATANCGRANGQYDSVLVDWRRRTFRELERSLDWLAGFLKPAGVLVIWTDPQKPAAMDQIRAALSRRGFEVEAGTIRDDGCAISARRREANPLRQAA